MVYFAKPPDRSKIALFDMDGTLVDFDGQMRQDLNKIAGPNEPTFRPEDDIWDESQVWLEYRKTLIKSQPGWWRRLPKFQRGWDVLHEAIRIGFDITVLTKGPYSTTSAWSEKVDWCRHYLPGVKVTITEDKSTAYGRILVDDWPKYVEPWLKVRPRGIVIMPAQPWNKDFKHERAIRYDGTAGSAAEVSKALEAAFDR